MRDLASEFQNLSRTYHQLEQELAGIPLNDLNDTGTYLESIFRNRDCLVRMEQTNSRALRLSVELKECRSVLDPKAKAEIELITEELRLGAIRLKDLCATHAEKIRNAQENLIKSRAELGKGSRYLQSIKPVKNNYPKFIDSLY